MVDDLGNPINIEDIVVHGGGTYSLSYYRVWQDPDSTNRIRVEALDGSYKNAVGKNPSILLNLSAMFGERYRDDEIVDMLRRKNA